MALIPSKQLGNIWREFAVTVPSGQTIVVDTLPLTNFIGINYLVNLLGNSRNKSFQLNVTKDNSDVSDVLFSICGAQLAVSVNVNNNSGNMELQIINNELFDIDVDFTRLVHKS